MSLLNLITFWSDDFKNININLGDDGADQEGVGGRSRWVRGRLVRNRQRHGAMKDFFPAVRHNRLRKNVWSFLGDSLRQTQYFPHHKKLSPRTDVLNI